MDACSTTGASRPIRKITVLGVGGVGGLLAGQLIRQYGDAVSLVARGGRGEHLRRQGLTIHSDLYGEYTVQPAAVAEDPAELGVQDLILVSVKYAQLETAAAQLAPIVGPDTLVLPVMNGVHTAAKLGRLLGKGRMLQSVIYVVSSAGEDYSITQYGDYTTIYLGEGERAGEADAKAVCEALKAADIDCRFAPDVQAAIWSKYVLNCAYNVVTARWGVPIGAVKHRPELAADYRALMEETVRIAAAEGVKLPDDQVERHLARLAHTTDDSTSSLSRDFDAGRVGEMELFSGEAVRMAQAHGIDAPVTCRYYEGLKERASAAGSKNPLIRKALWILPCPCGKMPGRFGRPAPLTKRRSSAIMMDINKKPHKNEEEKSRLLALSQPESPDGGNGRRTGS